MLKDDTLKSALRYKVLLCPCELSLHENELTKHMWKVLLFKLLHHLNPLPPQKNLARMRKQSGDRNKKVLIALF